MDSLSIKAKTKIILQNQLKDSSKTNSYLTRIEESFKEQGQSENTTVESNKIQSLQNRKLTNFNQIKWGSLKKFLYKRRVLQNIQMQHTSQQLIAQPVNEQSQKQSIYHQQPSQQNLNIKSIEDIKSHKQSSIQSNETGNLHNISSAGISTVSISSDFQNSYLDLNSSVKQSISAISNSTDNSISSVDSNILAVKSTSEVSNYPRKDKTKTQIINNQQNNIKNNGSTITTPTVFNIKQKNLSVKTEKQLNHLIFKRIDKSQLNSTMSDDQYQLSYEEEVNIKTSSSYRNTFDATNHLNFEQRRQKTWETSYSFLENSYKSNGCANLIFSPSPNTSQIIDERLVPERCQNPLSRDIQFLNLANDENNFLELKKKIMFDENLFDFDL